METGPGSTRKQERAHPSPADLSDEEVMAMVSGRRQESARIPVSSELSYAEIERRTGELLKKIPIRGSDLQTPIESHTHVARVPHYVDEFDFQTPRETAERYPETDRARAIKLILASIREQYQLLFPQAAQNVDSMNSDNALSGRIEEILDRYYQQNNRLLVAEQALERVAKLLDPAVSKNAGENDTFPFLVEREVLRYFVQELKTQEKTQAVLEAQHRTGGAVQERVSGGVARKRGAEEPALASLGAETIKDSTNYGEALQFIERVRNDQDDDVVIATARDRVMHDYRIALGRLVENKNAGTRVESSAIHNIKEALDSPDFISTIEQLIREFIHGVFERYEALSVEELAERQLTDEQRVLLFRQAITDYMRDTTNPGKLPSNITPSLYTTIRLAVNTVLTTASQEVLLEAGPASDDDSEDDTELIEEGDRTLEAGSDPDEDAELLTDIVPDMEASEASQEDIAAGRVDGSIPLETRAQQYLKVDSRPPAAETRRAPGDEEPQYTESAMANLYQHQEQYDAQASAAENLATEQLNANADVLAAETALRNAQQQQQTLRADVERMTATRWTRLRNVFAIPRVEQQLRALDIHIIQLREQVASARARYDAARSRAMDSSMRVPENNEATVTHRVRVGTDEELPQYSPASESVQSFESMARPQTVQSELPIPTYAERIQSIENITDLQRRQEYEEGEVRRRQGFHIFNRERNRRELAQHTERLQLIQNRIQELKQIATTPERTRIELDFPVEVRRNYESRASLRQKLASMERARPLLAYERNTLPALRESLRQQMQAVNDVINQTQRQYRTELVNNTNQGTLPEQVMKMQRNYAQLPVDAIEREILQDRIRIATQYIEGLRAAAEALQQQIDEETRQARRQQRIQLEQQQAQERIVRTPELVAQNQKDAPVFNAREYRTAIDRTTSQGITNLRRDLLARRAEYVRIPQTDPRFAQAQQRIQQVDARVRVIDTVLEKRGISA
ncbi:MAG: hypothetical protein HYV32_03750 [Candidatus Kerfeldbacteria bacterium]|nr:hypothetical protein [Candidatus Kerfeldbacteria bacterium]